MRKPRDPFTIGLDSEKAAAQESQRARNRNWAITTAVTTTAAKHINVATVSKFNNSNSSTTIYVSSEAGKQFKTNCDLTDYVIASEYLIKLYHTRR